MKKITSVLDFSFFSSASFFFVAGLFLTVSVCLFPASSVTAASPAWVDKQRSAAKGFYNWAIGPVSLFANESNSGDSTPFFIAPAQQWSNGHFVACIMNALSNSDKCLSGIYLAPGSPPTFGNRISEFVFVGNNTNLKPGWSGAFYYNLFQDINGGAGVSPQMRGNNSWLVRWDARYNQQFIIERGPLAYSDTAAETQLVLPGRDSGIITVQAMPSSWYYPGSYMYENITRFMYDSNSRQLSAMWIQLIPIPQAYSKNVTRPRAFAHDFTMVHNTNDNVFAFVSLGRLFAMDTSSGQTLYENDAPCGFYNATDLRLMEFDHVNDIQFWSPQQEKLLMLYGHVKRSPSSQERVFAICVLKPRYTGWMQPVGFDVVGTVFSTYQTVTLPSGGGGVKAVGTYDFWTGFLTTIFVSTINNGGSSSTLIWWNFKNSYLNSTSQTLWRPARVARNMPVALVNETPCMWMPEPLASRRPQTRVALSRYENTEIILDPRNFLYWVSSTNGSCVTTPVIETPWWRSNFDRGNASHSMPIDPITNRLVCLTSDRSVAAFDVTTTPNGWTTVWTAEFPDASFNNHTGTAPLPALFIGSAKANNGTWPSGNSSTQRPEPFVAVYSRWSTVVYTLPFRSNNEPLPGAGPNPPQPTWTATPSPTTQPSWWTTTSQTSTSPSPPKPQTTTATSETNPSNKYPQPVETNITKFPLHYPYTKEPQVLSALTVLDSKEFVYGCVSFSFARLLNEKTGKTDSCAIAYSTTKPASGSTAPMIHSSTTDLVLHGKPQLVSTSLRFAATAFAFSDSSSSSFLLLISFPKRIFQHNRNGARTPIAVGNSDSIFVSYGSTVLLRSFPHKLSFRVSSYALDASGSDLFNVWQRDLDVTSRASRKGYLIPLNNTDRISELLYTPKEKTSDQRKSLVQFSLLDELYTLDAASGTVLSQLASPCGFPAAIISQLVPAPSGGGGQMLLEAPVRPLLRNIDLGSSSKNKFGISHGLLNLVNISTPSLGGLIGICALESSSSASFNVTASPLWKLTIADIKNIVSVKQLVRNNNNKKNASSTTPPIVLVEAALLSPKGTSALYGINVLTGSKWMTSVPTTTSSSSGSASTTNAVEPVSDPSTPGQFVLNQVSSPSLSSSSSSSVSLSSSSNTPLFSLIDENDGQVLSQCSNFACKQTPTPATSPEGHQLFVCGDNSEPKTLRAVYFDKSNQNSCTVYWQKSFESNIETVSVSEFGEISASLVDGATATSSVVSNAPPTSPPLFTTTSSPNSNNTGGGAKSNGLTKTQLIALFTSLIGVILVATIVVFFVKKKMSNEDVENRSMQAFPINSQHQVYQSAYGTTNDI